MLYNTQWEKKPAFDPLSFASLIAWLEKQPADKTYDYVDCTECLLSQYYTAMGYQNVEITPIFLSHGGPRRDGRVQLPYSFNLIARGNGVGRSEWTFGHALVRARQLAKESVLAV